MLTLDNSVFSLCAIRKIHSKFRMYLTIRSIDFKHFCNPSYQLFLSYLPTTISGEGIARVVLVVVTILMVVLFVVSVMPTVVATGVVVTVVVASVVVVFGLLGQSSSLTHFRLFSSLSRPGRHTHFATQGKKQT